MLKFMREYLGKWFLFAIVALIGLVFVLSGAFSDRFGMGGSSGSNEVASVGDEHISLREYQNVVNREMEMYKQLGSALPESFTQNIRQQALSGLVQQKMVLQEAKRLGITAGDKEVQVEIQKLPYFQNPTTKSFDVELYKKILGANNLYPEQFESNVRESLIYQRVMKFLEERMKVTDEELKREYTIAGEQRNLNFVRLTKEDAYKKMKVTADELKKFLADPNKASLIQTQYTQNSSKYNREEEVCARHILKRSSAEEKANTTPPVPKEFSALKPTVKNFAELAKKFSDDPGSKVQGGELGCFGKGMMDKAFEDTAFHMSVGEISKPVFSKFGWHYIYVYKKNPALKIPLDKVKDQLAEELLKKERIQEVRKINKEEADKIATSWKGKGPASSQETGLFGSLEGYIPKIGRAPEILTAAFDSKAPIQKSAQVFESQGTFIVASIKERKSADMVKLEKERDNQLRNLKNRKLQVFMPVWLESIKDHTKVKVNERLLSQM